MMIFQSDEISKICKSSKLCHFISFQWHRMPNLSENSVYKTHVVITKHYARRLYEWTMTPRRAFDFPIWLGPVHQIQLIIPTCWLFLLIIFQCTMLYGFTRRLTSKPKHKGENYEKQIHTTQSICKFNATLHFNSMYLVFMVLKQ